MAVIDRLQGVRSSQAIKAPVRAATTANIVLSGEQTLDGIAVITDDRVLVKDQTDATENGIYVVSTGAWARSLDFNKDNDITEGTMVNVNEGTLFGNVQFQIETPTPSIGVTAIAWGIWTSSLSEINAAASAAAAATSEANAATSEANAAASEAAAAASEAAAATSEANAAISEANAAAAALFAGRDFEGVSELIADSTMAYSGGTVTVSDGDLVRAAQFAYVVLDAADATQNLTTAGGVKLRVLPADDGSYALDAFGAARDGVTDDRDIVFNAATFINSIGGGVLRFSAGTYLIGRDMQFFAFNNVHLIGAGRSTLLIKNDNLNAALIRFVLGTENSVREMRIDCAGYSGRGIFLQDIRSKAISVEVLNCPNRPFGMNGGSNTVWGLDSGGREDGSPGFTGAVFFPEECEFLHCRAVRAGRTAFSAKQMRRYLIHNCRARQVYSEGVTADGSCNFATISSCVFEDTARTDGATEFPDLVNGGFLTVGGGGVGGCGIDASNYVRVIGCSWIGVEENIATINDRTKSAINYVNNIAATFGGSVIGCHFEDAKLGIWQKSIADGAAGQTFKAIFSDNTFTETGTAPGAGSAEYGDIWLSFGGNIHVGKNTHTNGTYLVTDATGNNVVEVYEPSNFTPTLAFGGNAVGLTYGTQFGFYQRLGRFIFFELRIVLTAKGTSTGPAVVSGLPLPADVNDVGPINLQIVTPGATIPLQPFAKVTQGAATLDLFVDRSSGASPNTINDTHFSDTTELVIQGHYRV